MKRIWLTAFMLVVLSSVFAFHIAAQDLYRGRDSGNTDFTITISQQPDQGH